MCKHDGISLEISETQENKFALMEKVRGTHLGPNPVNHLRPLMFFIKMCFCIKLALQCIGFPKIVVFNVLIVDGFGL